MSPKALMPATRLITCHHDDGSETRELTVCVPVAVERNGRSGASYSVDVPCLPGCRADGSTRWGAIEQVRRAIVAALAPCVELGQPSPFRRPEQQLANRRIRLVEVEIKRRVRS